eukprot:gene2197-3864_t
MHMLQTKEMHPLPVSEMDDDNLMAIRFLILLEADDTTLLPIECWLVRKVMHEHKAAYLDKG